MSAALPFPSDPTQEIRVSPAALLSVLEKLLIKSSMFQFDASVAAARILEADLYGTPSHGVTRFCQLLDAIDAGDVDPRGRILTTLEAPGLAALDGSRALGMVAATKAVELAIAKCQEHGSAIVVVGNSQTLGSAQVYVRLLAAAGLIGLCCSSTGPATMAAPGTSRPATGNSAFAYGVPLGASPPLIFDSACGVESWGKLDLLRRYGVPIPEGLLLDAKGHPTTDPLAAAVLQPAGGTLGFGLSLLCSTLAGPLIGGKMPLHKKKRVDADDSQHFFLAIDPSKFGDAEKFQAEISRTLSEIAALPAENPQDAVRIPGRRGWQTHQECQSAGIPLHRTVADEILARAAKKKIAIDW